MAYRDAVNAVLNMVQWDIEKGDSIEMLRANWNDKVVIRDYDTHWMVIYRTNVAYRRLVPKGGK